MENPGCLGLEYCIGTPQPGQMGKGEEEVGFFSS